ncbi:MAG: MBL fold metallo-hydrolase [Promethearchaeota archaeon]
MVKIEIVILTNNTVLPFLNLRFDYGLDFIELNKLYVTQSLAEHGIGFLINIYETRNTKVTRLLKKIIFDTGGPNFTFLHNLDLRKLNLHDVDFIILSHWHYDHIGSLYKILERIGKNIPIICHESSQYERFFKRSKDVKKEDLLGKKRQEILYLLRESKIINQKSIDLELIKELKGEVIFSKGVYEILNTDELKITVSGEIPRTHKDEDFDNAIFLQDNILKLDKIYDDKCLILEFKDNVGLLNGCCHSGLKNTLDYVKKLTDKPLRYIIGGLHMAGASDERITNTIEYLKTFQEYKESLYIFPIHCSGEKFIKAIEKENIPKIRAFNTSVGTKFTLYG